MMRLVGGLVGAMRRLWPLWLISGAGLIIGVALWVAFVQPSWVLDTSGLKGADLAKARNDFRGTILTALGGLALIVGAIVGGLNLAHNRRVLEETQRQNRAVLELQRRGQVTERFSKAIEQLGQDGPEKLDVRIGAVYALEQIARDSAELHWPIMEVLTAHLREYRRIRYPPPGAEDGASKESEDAGIPAEAQAIATVIGRRRVEQDRVGQRLDLREVDLRHVQWARANLEAAQLRDARLDGADLIGAQLVGSNLIGARLDGANLRDARLDGADLIGAQLLGSNLIGASLEGAKLIGARLDGTDLIRALLVRADLGLAHLKGADLHEARLDGSNLVGARLDGANLIGAHLERADLGQVHLEGATLTGAHMEGSNLIGAHTERTNLQDVDLTEVVNLTWGQAQEALNVDLDRLPADIRQEADRASRAAAMEPPPDTSTMSPNESREE